MCVDLFETIKKDIAYWEKVYNKDRLLTEYMNINKNTSGLYQLTLNGCELWHGTLTEINAIVKSMIIRAEKDDNLIYLEK